MFEGNQHYTHLVDQYVAPGHELWRPGGAIAEHYGLDTSRLPTIEQIADRKLFKKKLLKAVDLHMGEAGLEPCLVWQPPMTRHEMVDLFDGHPVLDDQKPTVTAEFEDDRLWSNGFSEEKLKWEPWIMVLRPYMKGGQVGHNAYHWQATNWGRRFESQGLRAQAGARSYLALQMTALLKGEEPSPIDPDPKYHVLMLNPRTMRKDSPQVAMASWKEGGIVFEVRDSERNDGPVRMRPVARGKKLKRTKAERKKRR